MIPTPKTTIQKIFVWIVAVLNAFIGLISSIYPGNELKESGERVDINVHFNFAW